MTHFDFGFNPSAFHTRLYPSNMPAIRQEFILPCQELILISGAERRDTTSFALFFTVFDVAHTPIGDRSMQMHAIVWNPSGRLDANPNEAVSF
jgi:hypothetical protein